MKSTKSYKIFGCVLCAFILSGCGTYPQFRTNTSYDYIQNKYDENSDKITKDSIEITDKGTAENIISPVNVQACRGNKLLVKEVEKYRRLPSGATMKYMDTEPVFEDVYPLNGIYVRRMRVHNTTEHMLQLGMVDAVLVDPAGKDHEIASGSAVEQYIFSQRPCNSTRAIVESINSLKFLGSGNERIRPGREEEYFIAFPGTTIDIPGEWRLEFNDFPTETNESGAVTKKESFEFPFELKKYKTTVQQRQDGFMKDWVEVSKNREEVKN